MNLWVFQWAVQFLFEKRQLFTLILWDPYNATFSSYQSTEILFMSNLVTCPWLVNWLSTHHSSVPHHWHSFFYPVGSFWNQSEIVLPDSFLCCGEASMSAGRHLQISTAERRQEAHLNAEPTTGENMEKKLYNHASSGFMLHLPC